MDSLSFRQDFTTRAFLETFSLPSGFDGNAEGFAGWDEGFEAASLFAFMGLPPLLSYGQECLARLKEL